MQKSKIPPRDPNKILKPKPASCKDCSHEDQVKNAFDYFFTKHRDMLEDLAKY